MGRKKVTGDNKEGGIQTKITSFFSFNAKRPKENSQSNNDSLVTLNSAQLNLKEAIVEADHLKLNYSEHNFNHVPPYKTIAIEEVNKRIKRRYNRGDEVKFFQHVEIKRISNCKITNRLVTEAEQAFNLNTIQIETIPNIETTSELGVSDDLNLKLAALDVGIADEIKSTIEPEISNTLSQNIVIAETKFEIKTTVTPNVSDSLNYDIDTIDVETITEIETSTESKVSKNLTKKESVTETMCGTEVTSKGEKSLFQNLNLEIDIIDVEKLTESEETVELEVSDITQKEAIIEVFPEPKRGRCSASNNKRDKPRWQNQEQMVYMALCSIPGQEANRTNLLQMAVDLDIKISKEKRLPRTFSGKTPKNSASAILTANVSKLFVMFKKSDSKLQHFRLAFPPNNFEFAVMKYKGWEKELYETHYPIQFSTENIKRIKFEHLNEDGRYEVSEDKFNNFKNNSLLLRNSQPNTPLPGPDKKSELNEFVQIEDMADNSNWKVPTSWKDVLEVRPSTIPEAGQGLFATRDLPKDTILGYYFGVPTTEYEFDKNKEQVGVASHYSIMYQSTVLDATDINGQPFLDEQGPVYCPFHFINEHPDKINMLFLEGKQMNMIQCKTLCPIRRGEELFVFYGFEIAREHYEFF